MSIRFSLGRTATLVLCLAGFWAFGGFNLPELARPRAAGRLILMFIAGAVCVSLVDHQVGHMEPRTNLRGMYIIFGVLLMAGSCWFIYGLRSAG